MPRKTRCATRPTRGAKPRTSSARRREGISQGKLPLRPTRRNGARKVPPNDAPMPISRRIVAASVLFTLAVLLANAVAGDRGLIQSVKIRSEQTRLADSIEQIRRENHRLALQAERLRNDPSAIEVLAREELGLIRPNEQLFIVTNRPAPLP